MSGLGKVQARAPSYDDMKGGMSMERKEKWVLNYQPIIIL
jgi:hypothetical protein